MGLLFATHPRYLEHMATPYHPERPERLGAVLDGAHTTPVADALVPLEPRHATRDELERVHPGDYLDQLQYISEVEGGGYLDPDTAACPATWEACLLGAGGVLRAAEALAAGEAPAAFCAVRPPGHHATPQPGHGLLPRQQRGGHRSGAGRAG